MTEEEQKAATESQAAETATKVAEQAKVDAAAKAEADAKQESSSAPDMSGTAVEQVGLLVTAAGLAPSDVAKIVSDNNGVLTPAVFQKLVEVHGEATTNMIAENLKTFNATAVKTSNAVDEAIFAQVQTAFKGVTDQTGAETWAELSTWAKENIPNAERAEVNELLAKGGLSAKFAVDHLLTKFRGDAQYSQSAALEEGSNSASEHGVGMIGKAEYDSGLRALLAKGHKYESSPDIAKLQRQRQKGMRRGL